MYLTQYLCSFITQGWISGPVVQISEFFPSGHQISGPSTLSFILAILNFPKSPLSVSRCPRTSHALSHCSVRFFSFTRRVPKHLSVPYMKDLPSADATRHTNTLNSTKTPPVHQRLHRYPVSLSIFRSKPFSLFSSCVWAWCLELKN